MSKPGSRVEAALYELCVQYGYCIGAEAQDEIITNLPDDPDAFLDAVLRAEGAQQPELMDKHDREPLLELVRTWLFDDGEGRGAQSGLPRLPQD